MKLNNQLAPTDDVHIRRAIAYAMDYETIRDVIYPAAASFTPSLQGSWFAMVSPTRLDRSSRKDQWASM
jgi:ABC-type transport system substrate-binding protein